MKRRDHLDYDPLFKVSPLLKRLRDAMLHLEPEERHSVDEQRTLFKGRSGLKTIYKKQPSSVGLQGFCKSRHVWVDL